MNLITKKETTLKAINFDYPEHIPVWQINKNCEQGDILYCDLSVEDNGVNEWGYIWNKRPDGTLGHPERPVIIDWSMLKSFDFPTIENQIRNSFSKDFKAKVSDHYLLGNMGITGFTLYTFLRGFDTALIDFALQTPESFVLLEKIFSFENELIAFAASVDLDGVYFADDWGTQHGLIISPQMWRDIFKKFYKRQVDYAHRLGLQVWFHSCGNITDIVEDMHEIGIDVINISQPNVVDLQALGKSFNGKQCFMVPISYQTVGISGTAAQIEEEAKILFNLLAGPLGGLIAYVEDYSSMGMSEENYCACVKAFSNLI